MNSILFYYFILYIYSLFVFALKVSEIVSISLASSHRAREKVLSCSVLLAAYVSLHLTDLIMSVVNMVC